MTTSDTALVETPRLFLAGVGKGVGVSTLTLGLMSALRKAGKSVASAKVGTSLVATTHHRRVSGRLSHSFDDWVLDTKQCIDSLGRLASGADLILIEGEGGLHDERLAQGGFLTEADLAFALRAPVVLVVNASGLGESIAALVSGFSKYHPRIAVRGVIANFVADDAHDEVLRFAIEQLNPDHGTISYLGSLRVGEPSILAGVETGAGDNPSLLARSQLVAASDLVQAGIDFAAIMKLAQTAEPVEAHGVKYSSSSGISRIAIADDQAFHLMFQENLDLIRRSGAELVAFSPLADQRLPPRIKGVYLPSGYLHTYAPDLESNIRLLEALREFAQSGGAIFAEGAAVGLLCREVELANGQICQMAGILPATAAEITLSHDALLPVPAEVTVRNENIIASEGMKFRGLRERRFAYRLREAIVSCFDTIDRTELLTTDPDGPLVIQEGLSPLPNVLASTVIGNWASQPKLATHLTRVMRSIELTPKMA